MIYKLLKINDDGKVIYARIDDDGKCRLTCIAENPEFQEYLKDGGEFQDANGNVVPPELLPILQ